MKRILIIDDEEVVCLVIQKIAEKHGAESTIARTGKEAQKALRELEQFDVVFIDLLIPHVSGWDVLDSIKSSPAGERMPVVIVSGAPVSDKEKERLSKRVTAFVDKETFSLAGFEKLVQDILAGIK